MTYPQLCTFWILQMTSLLMGNYMLDIPLFQTACIEYPSDINSVSDILFLV